MKKSILLLTLAAVFGLTACVEDQIPRIDPSTINGHESVATKFFLNVSMGNQPTTKQFAADVQAAGEFRGIDDATLFAFSLKQPNDSTQPLDGSKVLSNHIVPERMYNLSTLFPKGTFSMGSETNNRMFEISLPTGTNSIIFYAKALRETKTSTTGNLDNDEVYGKLEYTAPGDGRTEDMTVIGSKARGRLNESNRDQYEKTKEIILGVVNHLLRVGINNRTVGESGGWDNFTVDSTYGPYALKNRALHWYDYKVSADSLGHKSPMNVNLEASELERILGKTYNALTTIDVPEIRSGAGKAIERQIGDLYSIMTAAVYSGAKNDEEKVAMEIIQRIRTNIGYFFTISADGNEATWKKTSDVVSALSAYYSISVSGTTGIDSSALRNFPREFHIPFGGASLIIDRSDAVKEKPYTQYAYNDNKINLSQVYYNKDTTASFYIGVEDYTYTPELCYYCNAPIHTTGSIPTESSFNITVANWPDYHNWPTTYGWNFNSHVTTDTRGVALANNVHYGVALMKSQVVMDSEILKDNNAALNSTSGNTEQDKEIKIGNNSFLTWTGILVAGQPSYVGWQYLALPDTSGNGSKFSKMVYDKVNYVNDDTEGFAIPTNVGTNSSSNYTMLFDNYNPNVADTVAQNTVFVALEFRNDLGVDFWGNANLVRQGGTFYIIGVMQPKNLAASFWTDAITEYEMLPPYDEDGKTKRVSRVFMQNCITDATFHVGVNSLKRAFTTVPDLRTARLSLGLSVDLNWQQLSSYDIILGQ